MTKGFEHLQSQTNGTQKHCRLSARFGEATEKTGELTGRGSGLRAPSSKSFGTKTLMSFRGCKVKLGCTVLLKGASADQLAAVKKILRV